MNTKLLFINLFFCLAMVPHGFSQKDFGAQWKNEIIATYRQFDNYSVKIQTLSTVRGVFEKGKDIDSTYTKMDSLWLYVENQNEKVSFVGANGYTYNGIPYVSYTRNDTNITISFDQNYISINSMSSFYGKYLDNFHIAGPSHFYCDILGRRPHWKTIHNRFDTVLQDKNYHVYEWQDSSVATNGIDMYENVRAFVNAQTHLIETIRTKRQNNTLAELGLGAIEREIVFTYLNFNYNAAVEKECFDTIFPHENFLVVREGFPWEASEEAKKGLEIQKQELEKWQAEEVVFSKKILSAKLADFNGNTICLNDINGWILLDTWYSSCYPCMRLMQTVNKHHNEFDKRNLRIISLNTLQTPTEYLRLFCQKQGIKIENLYFSKEINDDLKTITNIYPAVYLINPQKKVVYKTNDSLELNTFLNELDKAMSIKK